MLQRAYRHYVDEFYIHTRWRDLTAFENHAALPHTVRFVEVVEPLLDHPFKVTLFTGKFVKEMH